MRAGTGIFLIATGAILLFALSAGSPHWLNLQVVGVILILAGAAGLLLRGRPARDRLRRWVRPGQPPDSGGAPDAGEAPAGSGMDSDGDRPVRYASVGDD